MSTIVKKATTVKKATAAAARAKPATQATRARRGAPAGPATGDSSSASARPATPSLDERLAPRLLAEREARGWSAAELAERSAVSRAMISKIERGEANPTASLLGKLSAAFGLPLSLLLARVEGEASRLSLAAAQPLWRDPETGYVRRALSPPSDAVLQLTEVDLPPGARVAFPAAAYSFIHQQIWVLAGTLTFHEGATMHALGPGDCLALGPPVDCAFENATRKACRYVVAVVRR